MKRSGPLRRRTPLQPGSSQLARTGPLRSGSGGMRRTRSAEEQVAAQGWAVSASERCVVCGKPGTRGNPLEAHHVVPRAKLMDWCDTQVVRWRLSGSDENRLRAQVVWDRRNRAPVHQRRHEQHTTGARPLPARIITAACREFADEHGFGWYLNKHYVEGGGVGC